MQKRGMIFDTYDTAANGWTLAPKWKLNAAKQKTNYVDKPNGDGTWDLSTALSDGVPRYDDRNLTATFECSEGDRLSREAKIKAFINSLDGHRVNITLPDDVDHYAVGRLHITREYNDLAHAAVKVTAVCDPWLYAKAETVATLTAATTAKTAKLTNNGRRVAVPTLTVSGSGASVTITSGNASRAFGAGTYKWPELQIPPGGHSLTYRGTGSLVITYREAVLE